MAETMFYFAEGSERRGPFTFEQLKSYNITPETLVWYNGLTDWTPAAQAHLTAALFSDDSTRVSQPPHVYEQNSYVEQQYTEYDRPANMLVWAILVTVLCCWPFGIPAIVCAARVNALWAQGKYQEAIDSAKRARTWTIVSAAVGFTVIVVYFLMVVAMSSIGY